MLVILSWIHQGVFENINYVWQQFQALLLISCFSIIFYLTKWLFAIELTSAYLYCMSTRLLSNPNVYKVASKSRPRPKTIRSNFFHFKFSVTPKPKDAKLHECKHTRFCLLLSGTSQFISMTFTEYKHSRTVCPKKLSLLYITHILS